MTSRGSLEPATAYLWFVLSEVNNVYVFRVLFYICMYTYVFSQEYVLVKSAIFLIFYDFESMLDLEKAFLSQNNM